MAASGEYRAALHILTPQSANWTPPVVICSGLANEGLGEIWNDILRYRDAMSASNEFSEKRQRQAIAWMNELLEERILQRLYQDPKIRELAKRLESDVVAQRLTAVAAVEQIVSHLDT